MNNSKLSRLWGRVKQQAHLITFGHVFNAPWKSRDARRKTRYDATRRAVLKYLHRYGAAIRDMKPEQIDMTPEPERAFSIWFQGEEQAPPLVKACFRSMRKHLKQELVVLDEKTLFDWISLPDFVIDKWKKGIIPHTQFSDICRIELLYRHGGLWFDATDYVTAPVPQFIMDQDVFLFMGGQKIRGSYAFIQSCFMRAKKGNQLMGLWQQANFLYWKHEKSKINYFVHHLLLRMAVIVNPIAAELFAKMPQIDQDPTHALWGDHAGDKYNKAEFKRLTKDSFFQKCNYKDKRLVNMEKGTVAEYIVNSK